MNVTVRNVITSMRLISAFDWSEFFESVSLVDAILWTDTDFAAPDFRHEIVTAAPSKNSLAAHRTMSGKLPGGRFLTRKAFATKCKKELTQARTAAAIPAIISSRKGVRIFEPELSFRVPLRSLA